MKFKVLVIIYEALYGIRPGYLRDHLSPLASVHPYIQTEVCTNRVSIKCCHLVFSLLWSLYFETTPSCLGSRKLLKPGFGHRPGADISMHYSTVNLWSVFCFICVVYKIVLVLAVHLDFVHSFYGFSSFVHHLLALNG